MMSKKKILLLFPDGVGIRNYFYSDVFKNSTAELILFHNFDNETEADIKELTGITTSLNIPKYKESLREKFLRELICLSRLHYNSKKTNNSTILTNWNRKHKGLFKKIVYRTIEVIAPAIKNYGTILTLESSYQKAIRQNVFYEEVKNILQEIKPDRLFCSHQRALQAATVFAAAKDLGIPSATVIYSWDNLPKARMALRADSYLVWSEYMKNEMESYYPEIPKSHVYVTGTPQFEFYKDPKNIIEKDTFYKKFNLDPNKKIICYSGDDVLTSPDDPKYLEDIANSIVGAGLDSDYQILLRRCPVDLSGRFDEVIGKFPTLIKTADPLWNYKDPSIWTTVCPLPEDVSLLVSTAYYSDIVVNVGSTMAFDFCMFDKPCVFINYDQEQKTISNWSVNTIYQFQHFRSMPSSEAVIWLNSEDEILNIFNGRLLGFEQMKIWKTTVLGNYENASEKIKNILSLK